MANCTHVSEPTKRRIESALQSLTPKRTRPLGWSSPSLTSPAAAATATTTTTITATSCAGLAQCRPWCREDMLARLETFKVHLWRDKPAVLAPVQCAMHGWTNSAKDMLKCKVCSALLLIRFPEKSDAFRSEYLTKQYVAQLSSAHSESCGWRNEKCSDTIYGPLLSTTTETARLYQRNLDGLLKLSPSLPSLVHPLTSSHINTLKRLISSPGRHLENDKGSPPLADEKIHLTAAILCLFGWRADSIVSRPALRCELCFRMVGLWLFKGNAETQDASAPSSALANPYIAGGNIEPQPFDVVKEHQSYCFWVNCTSREPSPSPTAAAAAAAASSSSSPPLSEGITVASQLRHARAGAMPGWQREYCTLLKYITQDVPGSPVTRVGNGGASMEKASPHGGFTRSRPSLESITQRAREILSITPARTAVKSTAASRHSMMPQMRRGGNPARQTGSTRDPPSASKPLPPPISQLPQEPRTNGISSHQHLSTKVTDPSSTRSLAQPEASRLRSVSNNIPAVQTTVAATTTPATTVRGDDPGKDAPPVKSLFPMLDLEGLSELLGGGSITEALKDPQKAQAILDYVKTLLRQRNEEGTS